MEPLSDRHFEKLTRLLHLEGEAEREQAAQQANRGTDGRALSRLVIRDEDAGLGGRYLLTFGLRDTTVDLPPHRLQPGSPVILTCDNGGDPLAIRGMLFERTDSTVRVAIDEEDPYLPEGEYWTITLATDEISRRRQIQGMETARQGKSGLLARLRDILLYRRDPKFGPRYDKIGWRNQLNESQQEAVSFALQAIDLAIIHGPPGTGKTTVLVELIQQAVSRGERVLVCAPSHLAVDHLLDRLLVAGELPVRLGHPGRVSPKLRERTLDVLAEEHSDSRQARKLYKDAHALFRQAGKWTRSKPEPGDRADMRREGKRMIEDAKHLDQLAVAKILDRCSIICCTLTGLNPDIIGDRAFDMVVVDEACQSPEPASWLPILRSRKIVLAGDHCQLPPTVLSLDAARQGLNISMMERLVETYGEVVTRRLRTQYRMHHEIAAFSSEEFYESDLEAHESVRNHLLADLEGVTGEIGRSAVEYIDTAGAGYDEESVDESYQNPQEAQLIERRVKSLLEAGVAADQIAIITPYSAQVRLLRELILGIEIDSVDGFQGREKEAVLVSLVRSNPEGEVGFLADVRRTNVAITRARRKLIVIGDSATLGNHPFYQRLLSYFESIGSYRSVWEEIT
jgi:ATP-dependent RNA/DNA helicase IGHMBP2